MRFRLAAAGIALLCAFAPVTAHAHPHVWVDAASEIRFDNQTRITGIRHHWLFDEAFSAYALQGLDANRDGVYSAQELVPLAKENVESLADYGFFTSLTVAGAEIGLGLPEDYKLELRGDRLLLHFTLPLTEPTQPRGYTHLEIGDPEYYVAFSIPSFDAVRLVGAPLACRLNVHPAEKPDAAAAAALAQIGPDQRELPPDLLSLTQGTTNSAEIDCGIAASGGSAATAGEAAGTLAGGSGDLTALAAGGTEPDVATVEPAPARSAPASAGPMRRWLAWIGAVQTRFNRDLTDGLKALKEGGAVWWLVGVSFLYGIFHAAGPGHGKVVISSYLVANEARIRRGVAIAFISAFVQAVVAVALIGAMAVLLNMTSMAIDSTARLFEAGSFALVIALGLYLLVTKGRAAIAALRGGDAHAHHHHHIHSHAHAGPQAAHIHDAHCGHAHAPDPATLKPGLGGAIAAVVSVGLRPCSGALVVLVFALSQGVFWAGVAATFVMALGTALTVAALAALAVGAKSLARRLSSGDDRRAAIAILGIEIAAALLITLMGAVLLAGSFAGPLGA